MAYFGNSSKNGKYMVAVLARRHNIPFYVACPLSTIDNTISSGDNIPIEERPVNKVTGYKGNSLGSRRCFCKKSSI